MLDAPSNIYPMFKKRRDPFTGEQTGCDFFVKLTYNPSQLHVSATVDGADIGDPESGTPEVSWESVSAFPPTIKVNGITIPRDGLTHVVQLKFQHVEPELEPSQMVLGKPLMAIFELAAPTLPFNVDASLLRTGDNDVTDQVMISWELPVGDDYPVNIHVIDPNNKKFQSASAN